MWWKVALLLILVSVGSVALWSSLDLEFEQRIDVTGAATLLLALATAYLAWTTRSEAQATGRLVTLTTTQTERAHRPVIVPLNIENQLIEGTAHFARPKPSGNSLLIPVENVGMGPALKIEAVARIDGYDYDFEMRTSLPGLKVHGQAALDLATTRHAPPRDPFGFSGVVTYEDVAGMRYQTDLTWSLIEYRSVDVRQMSAQG